MAEQILKPSGRYVGKQILIFTLIAIAAITASGILGLIIAADGGPGGIFFGVVFLLAGLFWIVAALLIGPYYKSLRYEIHDDEVIVHVGIWTKSVKHVPFRTVTNIKIQRGILDRFVFNLGTLNVQTAGMSGNTGAEESLVGLANVQEIYELVAARLRKFRGAMSPTGVQEEEGRDREGGKGTLGELLSEVRAIRQSLENKP